MKKILVTGVNSYIGNSFRDYMKNFSDEYSVDGISCRGDAWKDCDFSAYDCVFHVAGIAHTAPGKITDEQRSLYYSVNCDLTAEVAEKAKKSGVGQFIFMSSAIVYGEYYPIGKPKRITRDTEPEPSGAYGDSKLQAEKKLHRLEDENFRVVILRPPMIYGKNSKGNYPILSKLAQKLPVFPKVDNSRSMLYVGNLVEFVRLMIKNNESGTFFPQNGEYSNTSELVRTVAKVHGKNIILVPGTEWALRLLAAFTPLPSKAFGSITYDMSMSEYSENYRLYSLEQSVRLTEG